MIIFCGIDPGMQGGISIISSDNTIKKTWDFKKITDKTIKNILKQLHKHNYVIHLENVTTVPIAGKSSNFKLGHSKGKLEGVLIGLELPYNLVHAKVWQKHFSIKRKKGETTNSWKKRLKGLAERLEPNMKVTLGNADAILIAIYSKQTYNLPDE